MKTLFAAIAAGVVAGAAAFGALAVAQGGDDDDPGTLSAVLTGAKEVDADGKKGVGDPDGRGGFTAVLDGRKLCYGIVVKNIGNPAQAHIHRGRKSVAGPVVHTLKVPTAGDPGAVGACTTLSEDLASDIAGKPRRFYVNVHNAAFAGGAVRGQISAKR